MYAHNVIETDADLSAGCDSASEISAKMNIKVDRGQGKIQSKEMISTSTLFIGPLLIASL